MLWYKGWLETRWRALLALGVCLFMVIVNRHSSAVPARLAVSFAFVWAMLPSWVGFSGAGVRTQPAFRTMKGLHGSAYFTLSLPVSRLRLLTVRATLGLVELAGVIAAVCLTAWIAIPGLRTHVALADLCAYVATVTVCISGIYFLSVLYATLLDEGIWLPWAGGLSVTALAWLLPRLSMLPSANLFRAMGPSSPLFTHTLPWASMGLSAGAAMVLFFAASRAIQAREY